MYTTRNKTDSYIQVSILVLATLTISTLKTEATQHSADVYADTLLDLKNHKNCASMALEPNGFADFWNSRYFLDLVHKVKLTDLEQELKSQLDEAAKEQMKYALKHYEAINKEIINQLKVQEKDIYKRIATEYTDRFIKLFIHLVMKKDSDDTYITLEKYYQKIEDAGELDYLAQQFFTHDYTPEFFTNYYLHESNKRVSALLKSLMNNYKDATEKYNNNWNSKMDEKTALFINMKGVPKHNNTDDYLNYIDYNTINASAEINADMLLLDRSYIPLSLLSYVFADYKDDQFSLFNSIYEIMNSFRLYARLNNIHVIDKISAATEFKDYLDNTKLDQDAAYYFVIVIFIVHSHPDISSFRTLKRDIKPSNQIIINFVKGYPDFKPLIATLSEENHLDIKINVLYGRLEGSKIENFEAIIEESLFSDQSKVNDEITEVLELLKPRSANDPVLNEKLQAIEHILFQKIFSYFVDKIDLDPQVVNHYRKLIGLIAEPLDLYSADVIGRILTAIDTPEKSFKISYTKMLEFFSNLNVQKEMISQTDKIINQIAMSSYCAEINFDFQFYGSVSESLCKGVKMETAMINDKFLDHFLKLLSFVRMFNFYSSKSTQLTYYYTRMYKYIAYNKQKFSIDNNLNDIVFKLNFLIEDMAAAPNNYEQFKPLIYDIKRIHDLLKLMNMMNIDLNNAQVIKKVKFDIIYFENIYVLLNVYERVNHDSFDAIIDRIYSHYSKQAAFYHFNNIYMLLKIHKIVSDSNADVNTGITKIDTILKNTNNITEPKNKTELISWIHVSRRAAFFFYVYYMRNEAPKNVFNSDLEELSKNDINALNINDQISLLKNYVIPKKQLVMVTEHNGIFGVKDNFKSFIQYGIKRLKETSLQNSKLYVYISIDYFKILASDKKDDQIAESGILDLLIKNIYDIYVINKASKFHNEIQKIGDTYASLTSEASSPNGIGDIMLINYYYVVDILKVQSMKNQTIDNQSVLYTLLNRSFNEQMREYLQKTNDNNTDIRTIFGYNIDYLLFSAKLLFYKTYKSEYFDFVPMNDKTNLNYIIGTLLLEYWSEGNAFYIDEKQIGNLGTELSNINKNYEKMLRLPDVEKLKAFNNLNDNILVPTCLSQLFSLIMQNGNVDQELHYLTYIASRCMAESNKEKLLETTFTILKNIRQFNTSRKDISLIPEGVKLLFTRIMETARETLSTREILYVIQGVLVGKKTLYYSKDFLTFISAVSQNYSPADVNQRIEEVCQLYSLSRDEIIEMKNTYINDIILLYDDNEKIDIDKIDTTQIDLFSLLLGHSKFAYFLTNLFTDINVLDTTTISDYLTLYIFMNSFRVKYLNKYELSNKDEIYNLSEHTNEFTRYTDKYLHDIIDPALRTKLFYLKLIHMMTNHNVFDDSSKINDCQFFNSIKRLNIQNSTDTYLNTSELKILIDHNSMAHNYVKYVYSLSLSALNKITYKSDGQICETTLENFRLELNKWNKLYEKLFGHDNPKTFKFTRPKREIEYFYNFYRILQTNQLLI